MDKNKKNIETKPEPKVEKPAEKPIQKTEQSDVGNQSETQKPANNTWKYWCCGCGGCLGALFVLYLIYQVLYFTDIIPPLFPFL